MRWSLAVVAVLLFALPISGAVSIQYDGYASLRHSTLPSASSTDIDFVVGFRVTNDTTAYVKVLATSRNPAAHNGTAGGPGWWTEVRLTRDGPVVGRTNGTTIVELGDLAANRRYELHLRIRAPEGALVGPRTYHLAYALAARPPPSGSGSSGGTLDPSLSVLPEIEVLDPTAAQGTEPNRPASSWSVWLAWVGGAAALALVVFVLARRLRGKPPSSGPPANPEAPSP